MRKLFIFLLLASLLVIPTSNSFMPAEGVIMNNYNINYNGNIYEPVDPYSTFTVTGSIHINSGPSKNSLRLRYELFSPLKFGMNKSYASGNVSTTFSYPATSDVSYSFKIKDGDNIARKGITIRFGVYDTANRTFINYKESQIWNKSHETYDLEENNYSLNINRCLYLDDRDASERYRFPNYSHLIEIEKYYRLDLSSLSFIYDSYKPFTYKEIYLSIHNSDLFPYISEVDNENNKKIALKAVQNGNIIDLAYEDLYVEPSSLTMSSSPNEGYERTHYFYLPKNKIKELQGLSLSIHALDIGVNTISFGYHFTVSFSKLLLGPCNDSLYCVVGGANK